MSEFSMVHLEKMTYLFTSITYYKFMTMIQTDMNTIKILITNVQANSLCPQLFPPLQLKSQFFKLDSTSPPRWQSRRTCTHLLLRELQNYNQLLNNCQQENAGSHQKKITHVQGQRSTNKTVGGARLHLESNLKSTRDTWKAQTKQCAHQEIPQRLSQTCL